MQNSPEKGDRVPRTICLDEMIPEGSSQPSHGLPPLPTPPPGIPRLPGGLNWAPRCSPEEWTAWCRVRDGLDVSNDFFEVVQIEQEEEEVFDLVGIAEGEGWDQTELMYFVFEFGTKKGMQYCREYYEMKNSARQVVPQGVEQEEEEEVFDLVGVAEAEGWDQTELMFFVFEYGAENGVSFCREYYEMKSWHAGGNGLVFFYLLWCTRLGSCGCAFFWLRPLGVGWLGHYLHDLWEENMAVQKTVTVFWDWLLFIWGQLCKLKPYVLAVVGRPSLHGYYACMVYWNKGALWRNCRLTKCM